MKNLTPLTEKTRYVWMNGEYVIHFVVKECAEQYALYHKGIVISV